MRATKAANAPVDRLGVEPTSERMIVLERLGDDVEVLEDREVDVRVLGQRPARSAASRSASLTGSPVRILLRASGSSRRCSSSTASTRWR